MKNSMKFLLICGIITIIGHDATAQNHLSQDELREINRWQSESQENLRLENQRSMQAFRDMVKSPTAPNVRLRYTIRMNRPGKYKLGEPIFIHDHVKNLSDYLVLMTVNPSIPLFSTVRVFLVDAAGNEVSMTHAGRQEDECVKNDRKDVDFIRNINISLSTQNHSPHDERDLNPSPLLLNRYFDLTRPGVYHLTFHRLNFGSKQLAEPLTSNTLTFEVLDEAITPEDLRDPGEFKPPQEEPSVK